MRRRLDGAPEASPFDERVRALCAPTSEADGAAPSVVQMGPGRVIATLPRGTDAAWLTDEAGTVVGFARRSTDIRVVTSTFNLKIDFDGTPQRLTPHAHDAASCRTAKGARVDTWSALLDEFNYMAAGGVVPNASLWDEATLQASTPQLQLLPTTASAKEHALRVSMRRQPGLPIPLIFAACTSASNVPLLFKAFSPHVGEVIGGPPADARMEDMTQSETHPAWWVDAPDTFEATLSVPTACREVIACASMPDGKKGGWGGPGPRRCARLDLLPETVRVLESRYPKVATVPASALLLRRARHSIVLQPTAACAGAASFTLYARSDSPTGAIVAFAEDKPQLNVALTASVSRVVAYQACGGTLSTATIEVPPSPPPLVRVERPPASAEVKVVTPPLSGAVRRDVGSSGASATHGDLGRFAAIGAAAGSVVLVAAPGPICLLVLAVAAKKVRGWFAAAAARRSAAEEREELWEDDEGQFQI